MSYEYSVDALVAVHEAFRDLIDTATGTASISIQDSSNNEMMSIPLSTPSGSVDPATGSLTFSDDGSGPHTASASGAASVARLMDGAGSVHLSMPCMEGSEPVSGYCVLSTANIVAGDGVDLVSLIIG